MMTPPNDTGIEMVVLGAIIQEPEAIYQAMTIIKPSTFYGDKHKSIYAAVLSLQNNNDPIDLRTVVNALRLAKKLDYVGGAYYVSQLTSNVGSALHIEKHCRILYELYLRREMLLCLNSQIAKISDNKDIFETYNQTSAELSGIFELSLSSNYHNMIDIMDNRLSEIAKIKKNYCFVAGC
jgi:replicative DNA helicase